LKDREEDGEIMGNLTWGDCHTKCCRPESFHNKYDALLKWPTLKKRKFTDYLFKRYQLHIMHCNGEGKEKMSPTSRHKFKVHMKGYGNSQGE